jgi:hypothetical protein
MVTNALPFPTCHCLQGAQHWAMHRKLSSFLLMAACCGALGITAVHARDGGNNGSDDNGDKAFEIELSMMPTTDAPPNSFARLSFEAGTENGTPTAELEIKVRNLPAGSYSVGAVLKSDGSTVVLGTLTVDNEGEGELELGHDGSAFPANVDPLDIGSVNITGVNGVVLFTVDLADLTMASSMNISVNAQLTAGPGVPNATGTVSVSGFASHGRVKGSLQFTGNGLPANTTIVVTVNGVAAKVLHTDKNGNFNVKLGPKGKTGTIVPGITLAGITSVAVLDRNGNVLLQASL